VSLRGNRGVTVLRAGSGVQPAMVLAHARAFMLSMTPGNRRRNSIAADSSPSSSKMARIAAASASVMTNIPSAWQCMPRLASRDASPCYMWERTLSHIDGSALPASGKQWAGSEHLQLFPRGTTLLVFDEEDAAGACLRMRCGDTFQCRPSSVMTVTVFLL
jgi:hypothetical protein